MNTLNTYLKMAGIVLVIAGAVFMVLTVGCIITIPFWPFIK